jgi:membrane carboxypeptidase/penicillin-binding protein
MNNKLILENRKKILVEELAKSKIKNKYINIIANDKSMPFKKYLATNVLKIENHFRPRILFIPEIVVSFFDIIFYLIGFSGLKNRTIGCFQIGILTSLKWTNSQITVLNYMVRLIVLNNFLFSYRVFILGFREFLKTNDIDQYNLIDKFSQFYNGSNFYKKENMQYSEILKEMLNKTVPTQDFFEINNFILKLNRAKNIREQKRKDTIKSIDDKINTRINKIKLLIDQSEDLSSVLMLCDKRTNKIIYYNTYGKKILNSPVIETRRLVGSTLKIALYSAYIEKYNSSIDEEFNDRPIKISSDNKIIMPRNADNKFRGNVTLEYAFANSINSVAIQVLMKLGVQNFINYLRKCGIQQPLPYSPLLALGAVKLTGQEILGTLSPILNKGHLCWPLFDNTRNVPINNGEKILSQHTFEKMERLLKATTIFGTGKLLNKANNKYVLGKTGTSECNRDLWFVGAINSKLYGLVWLGMHDEKTMISLDSYSVSASRFSVPLWSDLLDVDLSGLS